MQGRLVRSEPIGLQAHLLSYGIPFPIRREVDTCGATRHQRTISFVLVYFRQEYWRSPRVTLGIFDKHRCTENIRCLPFATSNQSDIWLWSRVWNGSRNNCFKLLYIGFSSNSYEEPIFWITVIKNRYSDYIGFGYFFSSGIVIFSVLYRSKAVLQSILVSILQHLIEIASITVADYFI